jgi:hypothetical protein
MEQSERRSGGAYLLAVVLAYLTMSLLTFGIARLIG